MLSLKDFNASKSIAKLINCGVKSFKIEGRLKDINYVKNVVAYYNILINEYANRVSSGKVFLDFEPNVDKTFNRGYTDYFLNGRGQCFNFLSPKSRGEKLGKIKRIFHNYFEIDAKLNPQDGICYISDGEMKGFLVNKVEGNKVYPNKMEGLKSGLLLYRNFDSSFEKALSISKTVRKIKVDFTLRDRKLIAKDEDNNVVFLDIPKGETPNNLEKFKSNITTQLSKTGDSDFYTGNISIKDESIPFLPVSKINELRRQILSLLMDERLKNYKRIAQKHIKYAKFPEEKWIIEQMFIIKRRWNFIKNVNVK